MQQSRFISRLAWLAALGFALRFAARAMRGADDFFTNGYTNFARLAQSMASGGGYALQEGVPTAVRVPFYPIFLLLTGGGHGQFWTVLLAQAAISVGTLVLTGLIARRLFGDSAGLLAAAIATVWPYAVWHDTALQETGLFTSLSALSVWMLLQLREEGKWWRALCTGLVLGTAILTRATLLPFALGAIFWLALPLGGPLALVRRLKVAFLTAAGLLLALSPWLVYSDQILGSPALDAESGRALYAGNHEQTFLFYPERSIDESRRAIFRSHTPQERSELQNLDPLAREGWYHERGWQAIADNPGRTLRYATAKLSAAFGPFPSPRKSGAVNWFYALSWFPVLLLGAAGMWLSRANWRRDLLFHGLIGSFCAVTALIWAHTSHRSFLDFAIIVFAAHALIRLREANWTREALARLSRSVQRGA